MASVFRSVSTGASGASTTNISYGHAGATLLGDLLFLAIAFSGSIGGITHPVGWFRDPLGLPNTGSTSLAVYRYWRAAVAEDVGGNWGASWGWATSRRSTIISAAYSLDYVSEGTMLNAAYGQKVDSVTTSHSWAAATPAVYPTRRTREIYFAASNISLTYPGSIVGGSGVTVRGQQNQTSGPSVMLADAALILPEDHATVRATKAVTVASSVYVTSTHSFRDEVDSSIERPYEVGAEDVYEKRVIIAGGF